MHLRSTKGLCGGLGHALYNVCTSAEHAARTVVAVGVVLSLSPSLSFLLLLFPVVVVVLALLLSILLLLTS